MDNDNYESRNIDVEDVDFESLFNISKSKSLIDKIFSVNSNKSDGLHYQNYETGDSLRNSKKENYFK